MELHQLRYCVAVADTGGFSRAAERCAVAQPSLSQQIQKLERELGSPLFDRLPRGALLTEAGQRLVRRARRILAEVADAGRCVRELGTAVVGAVRLGAIPTVAPYVLPRVLARFRRRYPVVELRIEEDLTEALIERVADGRLDLAVLALPVEHAQLCVEPLAREPLLLAASRDDRLARRRTVRFQDLANRPLIVLHEMHCLGRQIGSLCDRLGKGREIVFMGSQLGTIQRMVALGLGLSFIPEMAAREDNSSKRVYLSLGKEAPTRTLVAIWHVQRYRTNASRAMVEMLRRALQRSPATESR